MNRGTLGGWILVIAAAAYVAAEAWPVRVPFRNGPPLVAVWAIAVALVAVGSLVTRRRLEPVLVLAAVGIIASLLFDSTLLQGQPFRDLGIYLKAGLHFRLDQPIYPDAPIRQRPLDPTDYPYLYPPPTLPFAALLSFLPTIAVTFGWEACLVAATLVGLRAIGLRWAWILVILSWPPFAFGLYVGNVAILLFLVLAIAPWFAVGLVLGPVFKLQSGIAALWLVRDQRWREIVGGVLFLGILTLLTLPLTGVDRWLAWLHGLVRFSESQRFVPTTFYGLALAEYIPGFLAVALGLAVVAVALIKRRRQGLARLAVAGVVLSPSLYVHGFMAALPALLDLRALAFWAAIAITSVTPGLSWFGAIAIVVASWFLPVLRRGPAVGDRSEDALHPLAESTEPWPGAPLEPVQGKMYD